MTDQPNFWGDVWTAVAGSVMGAAVLWGAAGGATSALIIKPTLRDVVRQVTLGALAAGGLGVIGGAVLAKSLGIPTEAIPVVGSGGSVAYLVGVFGPAIFEVMLGRIRKGKLPGDKE